MAKFGNNFLNMNFVLKLIFSNVRNVVGRNLEVMDKNTRIPYSY